MTERADTVRAFLAALAPELVELHGLAAVTYAPAGPSGDSLLSAAASLLIAVSGYETGAGWDQVARAYRAHRAAWAVAAAAHAQALARATSRPEEAAG